MHYSITIVRTEGVDPATGSSSESAQSTLFSFLPDPQYYSSGKISAKKSRKVRHIPLFFSPCTQVLKRKKEQVEKNVVTFYQFKLD